MIPRDNIGRRLGEGPWVQTRSGIQLFPFDDRETEYWIEDIAHALSNQCRWTGHCSPFYSVAQHSVECARHLGRQMPFGATPCDRRDAVLVALLHDASEAYLSDIATPIKRELSLRAYHNADQRLQIRIYDRFRLREAYRKFADQVAAADKFMLFAERNSLMGKPPVPWDNESENHGAHLIRDLGVAPLPPLDARRDFLDLFNYLQTQRLPETILPNAKAPGTVLP